MEVLGERLSDTLLQTIKTGGDLMKMTGYDTTSLEGLLRCTGLLPIDEGFVDDLDSPTFIETFDAPLE